MPVPLPSFNSLASLVKKGLAVEDQEKILELREFAVKLREENVELRKQVKSLEEQAAIQKNVVWEAPYYWVVNGDEKSGPYCQRCYDKEKLLMRLQKSGKGQWICHSCNKVFRDDNYESPPRVISRGFVT